jgi:hypothetical protein
LEKEAILLSFQQLKKDMAAARGFAKQQLITLSVQVSFASTFSLRVLNLAPPITTEIECCLRMNHV